MTAIVAIKIYLVKKNLYVNDEGFHLLSNVYNKNIKRIVEEAYQKIRSNILKQTKVLIFGPGEQTPGYDLREAIKMYLISNGCRADYSEQILDKITISVVAAERILGTRYDLIFILLIGLGPSLEFAHYVRDQELARKFRIFQEARYKAKDGFLNLLLRSFCEANQNCCFHFGSKEELIRCVSRCLEWYVNYYIDYGHPP